MSDALSFVEIDGQHVELLPARTVLSLFSVGAPKGADAAQGGQAGQAGQAGTTGGPGGAGHGKAAFLHNWFYTEGDVYNSATGGAGGDGGAATTGGAGAAK